MYDDEASLKEKIETVAREIYGADGVSYAPAALKQLKKIEDMGFGNIETIAKEIYGAGEVIIESAAKQQIARIESLGFGSMPVCMAKTQYSLSDDPELLGRPEGFTLQVREAYVSAGAGFVVALTGDIMTMPGLPKVPAANKIDVSADGEISGLF